MYFFFFKQKTAYEMRISDWSSDVCSSDLSAAGNMPVDRIAPDPARDSLAKLALKSGLPWNKGELAALFHECKSTAGEVHATNEPTLDRLAGTRQIGRAHV